MSEQKPDLSPPPSASAIKSHFDLLHAKCGDILTASLEGSNETKVARSHQFTQEIEAWVSILSSRSESTLLKIAAYEYQFALLALTQGHYRHAFKGLRLVLELTMQSARLSTNEIELREWLQNKKDTVWASLIDRDNGVFSARYARCFFPNLDQYLTSHCSIAEQVYRECSECVHGNMPKHVPLPDTLEFTSDSFEMWHAKAGVVALLFHFVMAMRYLLELADPDKQTLESILLARVGHVKEIRIAMGGVQGN